jgi:hypothetical protein
MPSSERELELLSSYIDEQLTPQERAALEARLASEADLRRELESLRTTVSLVKMAERVRVPRNFTLDPKKYGKAVPASFWQRWGLAALTPLASAGAALAVMMIVGGGILMTSGLRSPQAEMSAPAGVFGQAQAPRATPAAAMPAAATEAPTEQAMLAAEAPSPSAADAALASPAPTPAAGIGASGPSTSGGAGGGLPPNPGGGRAPVPTQAVVVQGPPESGSQPYGSSPSMATLTDQGVAESAPATTEKSGAGGTGVPAEQPPANNGPDQAADHTAASQPAAELPVLPFVGGGLTLAGVGLLIAMAILGRRRA